MRALFIAILASIFLAVPATASPVAYQQFDDAPDFIILAADAPEGAYEATDLEWIKVVQDADSRPRTVKVVFKIDEYSDDFNYEIGLLLRSPAGKVGQIFTVG